MLNVHSNSFHTEARSYPPGHQEVRATEPSVTGETRSYAARPELPQARTAAAEDQEEDCSCLGGPGQSPLLVALLQTSPLVHTLGGYSLCEWIVQNSE